MAGKDNLIPTNQRTKEEARELGRKGGIASGEARREKKTMREMLEYLLAKKVEGDKTCLEVIMTSATQKAMSGDIKAMEFVRDTSGQKPDTQITLKDLKTIPYNYNPDKKTDDD